MSDWAVISLGNRFRGDDSVGPYILQNLRKRVTRAVLCIENNGDMTRLLDEWKGRRVCLVDAVVAEGRSPGDIIRLNGLAKILSPSLCTTSSHGLNLAEALELGRLMNALPHRLEVYAICGENFSPGAGPSAAVKSAANAVEQEILAIVNTQTGGPRCTSSP